MKENDYKKRKELESARRRLRTRLSRCEEAVDAEEKAIAQLHEQLSDEKVAADYERVLTLSEELSEHQAELSRRMEEWERLQAEADAAES